MIVTDVAVLVSSTGTVVEVIMHGCSATGVDPHPAPDTFHSRVVVLTANDGSVTVAT